MKGGDSDDSEEEQREVDVVTEEDAPDIYEIRYNNTLLSDCESMESLYYKYGFMKKEFTIPHPKCKAKVITRFC